MANYPILYPDSTEPLFPIEDELFYRLLEDARTVVQPIIDRETASQVVAASVLDFTLD